MSTWELMGATASTTPGTLGFCGLSVLFAVVTTISSCDEPKYRLVPVWSMTMELGT